MIHIWVLVCRFVVSSLLFSLKWNSLFGFNTKYHQNSPFVTVVSTAVWRMSERHEHWLAHAIQPQCILKCSLCVNDMYTHWQVHEGMLIMHFALQAHLRLFTQHYCDSWNIYFVFSILFINWMSLMTPTKVTSIVPQPERGKKCGGWWIIAQLVALAAISPSEVPQLCRQSWHSQCDNSAAESIHNCNNYHPDVICRHVRHFQKRRWNWVNTEGWMAETYRLFPNKR